MAAANDIFFTARSKNRFELTSARNLLVTMTLLSSKSGLNVDVTDICRRLSPPPVPSWLLDSPEKLRHKIENCSSWKRYKEMCAQHLSPDFPVALQTQQTESELTVLRWIPFMVVITIVLLMVTAVCLLYTMYKQNRLKHHLFASYHKHSPTSTDFCSPRGGITPSVTVETQLSICALEDDGLSPYALYDHPINSSAFVLDSPRRSCSMGRSQSLPLEADKELVLEPSRLDEDGGMPFVVAGVRSVSDYCTSHSSPIEFNGSDRPSNASRRLFDEDEAAYVQLKNNPAEPVYNLYSVPDVVCQGTLQSSENNNGARKIVNRCREVGHNVIKKMSLKRRSESSRSHFDGLKSRMSLRNNEPLQKLRKSFGSLRKSKRERHSGVSFANPEYDQCDNSENSNAPGRDVQTRLSDGGCPNSGSASQTSSSKAKTFRNKDKTSQRREDGSQTEGTDSTPVGDNSSKRVPLKNRLKISKIVGKFNKM